MKLFSLRVKNYKSISDTGRLTLNNVINIFAGKNNVGKTAVIEALYNCINADYVDYINGKHTWLELEIEVEPKDMSFLNKRMKSEQSLGNNIKMMRISYLYNADDNVSSITEVWGKKETEYERIYLNNSTLSSSEPIKVRYQYSNLNGNGVNFGGRPKGIDNFFSLINSKIVFISGNRNVPDKQLASLNIKLATQGTNLNGILYTLRNNEDHIFEEIKTAFKKIFNDVSSISTPIDEENNTTISLQFEGSKEFIPLYKCGSGFTHVLLLLVVLYTQEESVILFDEPHVFLHPSAEKAIYDLINETNYHQYLLTTHSPILINYPFEKKIFHVKKEDGKSDYFELEILKELIQEIGVSNSDFALSDKVLFVEGETEEAILPMILEHFGMKQIGYNYRILKMGGTGSDFIKKTSMTNHREKLDLILSGISPSPIPYKIIIDMDEKSLEKIGEIKDKYGENIIVLDRREIENYFLESFREISETINKYAEGNVSNPQEIGQSISEIFTQTGCKKIFPRDYVTPLNNVIGSRVLDKIFDNYGLIYNKVIHGATITELILKNDSGKFLFFKERLEGFIKSNQ